MNRKIKEYRKKIDKINSDLLKLVAKRMQIVKKIGMIKRQNHFKVLDKNREKEILDKITKRANDYSLDRKFVSNLFKIIIRESRKNQNSKV